MRESRGGTIAVTRTTVRSTAWSANETPIMAMVAMIKVALSRAPA
jgi:hypothetical protein